MQSKQGTETENVASKKEDPSKDSLGFPVEKSPITVFAALQIPLVILMVLIAYMIYQSRSS